MRTFRMTIAYDGGAFHGFQVQKNAKSVCSVFQDAVEIICRERGAVKGCSRTDAGVHALEYVLTLTVSDYGGTPRQLKGSLNGLLPLSVSVLSCTEAEPGFHPRYDVKEKEYLYKIWNHESRSPFWEGRALHYPRYMDLDLLNEGCKVFLGTHDFSAFCAKHTDVEDKVRTISQCGFSRQDDLVVFAVRGDGFLYNMVRIMVGTLLRLNEGRFTVETLRAVLESKDRRKAGITAPPHGLYLHKVFYD